MSTSIISDTIAITGPDPPITMKMPAQNDVEFAKCECCGLTEECTLAYIETIRARYQGKWVCGLCAEAVKDEIMRYQKLIGLDEAMARHFNFCNTSRSPPRPEDPTVRLITAMRQLLRKSLDSPKSTRSMPCSPTKNRGIKNSGFARSESCIPSLSLDDSSEELPLSEFCGSEEGCV